MFLLVCSLVSKRQVQRPKKDMNNETSYYGLPHEYSAFPAPLTLFRESTMSEVKIIDKVCMGCNSMFQAGVEQEWKTHCGDCYKSKVRKCGSCDRNMRIDAPDWKKDCGKCWLEKRKQTYATCPTCPEDKRTLLRRKTTERACDDCKRMKVIRPMLPMAR